MKKIITFGIILMLLSCSSHKTNDVIPYLLNIETEESIYNAILKLKDSDNIVFHIEHISDSKLKIHLLSSKKEEEFLSSNRRIFINNKLYPVSFDTDYLFYSKSKDGFPVVSVNEGKQEISMPSLEDRKMNKHLYGYKKIAFIIDHSLYWIIDNRGKLLETNSP